MIVHAFRILPGEDLRLSIEEFVAQHCLQAAVILACVGSLTKVVLRYAGSSSATELHDRFEIVSMEATLSAHGSHFHIAVSDGDGNVKGGHLLPGSIVYTTAEMVIGEIPGLTFQRVEDPATGYCELVVQHRS